MSISRTAKKGVTYYNPSKAYNGYTLFAPLYTRDVWLIDMEGNIVQRWRMPYIPGQHAYILPNGNLLWAGKQKTPDELGLPLEFGGIGGLLREIDWQGNVVWEAQVPYQNHDFVCMSNGHVLFPSYSPEGVVPSEMAAKLRGGLPGTEFEGKVFGDCVLEIDRTGEIVWQWIAHQHLDPEIDVMCPLENRNIWPLLNAVFLCKDGSLLLSGRNCSEIIRVKYPEGHVLARYGRGKISHQHDPRELENGNILVFDNGAHRQHDYNESPSFSRVVEIDPKNDEIVWEYRADPPTDFYSALTSGAERMPNGNTVICESWQGRVFEVTHEGELVWEYVSPFVGRWPAWDTNAMWRAHRYSPEYPGFEGKPLDPARFEWENRTYGPRALNSEVNVCIV